MLVSFLTLYKIWNLEMHAEVIKSQITNEQKRNSLREQLNKDLEIFLAKKGNQITKLNHGETQYPDGVLPYSRTYKGERKTELDVSSVDKDSKSPKVVSEKEEVKSNPVKVITPKSPLSKKNTAPKPKKTVQKSEPSAEAIRLRKVAEAKKNALANGEKSFIAPCRNHGETKFFIDETNRIHCGLCRCRHNNKKFFNQEIDPKVKEAHLKDLERRRKNRKLRDEAIEKGENTFNGECKNCGETELKILYTKRKSAIEKSPHDEDVIHKDMPQIVCISCKKSSNKNNTKRRDHEKGSVSFEVILENLNMTELERRAAVTVARNEAIAQGKNEFTAPCAEHGYTVFRLRAANAKGKPTSRCLECSRKTLIESRAKPDSKYQIKRAAREKARLEKLKAVARTAEQVEELERRRELDEARKKAVENGETEFTARCKTHGETQYKIVENRSRCILCKKNSSNKYNRNRVLKQKGIEVPPSISDSEAERRKELNDAKELAIEKGLNKFVGRCIHHGKTIFFIVNDKARCLLCRRNIQNKCHGIPEIPKQSHARV